MNAVSGCDLTGLGVLVTRPAHQAESLCRLIAENGGRPLAFPAMEILPPTDPEAAQTLLSRHWDLAIYISPNAVRFAPELTGDFPKASLAAAVGKGSAGAMRAAGVPVELVPERFDSEGLLTLPELNHVAGRRILIIRGEGGRGLLGDTLTQRGAAVSYAEVYRRAIPQTDPRPLLARWKEDVQVVITTSSDVLKNLATLLGDDGAARLSETPLLVISERMVPVAERLKIKRIIRADGADDASLVKALCRWSAG